MFFFCFFFCFFFVHVIIASGNSLLALFYSEHCISNTYLLVLGWHQRTLNWFWSRHKWHWTTGTCSHIPPPSLPLFPSLSSFSIPLPLPFLSPSSIPLPLLFLYSLPLPFLYSPPPFPLFPSLSSSSIPLPLLFLYSPPPSPLFPSLFSSLFYSSLPLFSTPYSSVQVLCSSEVSRQCF